MALAIGAAAMLMASQPVRAAPFNLGGALFGRHAPHGQPGKDRSDGPELARAGPFNLGDELFGGHALPWQRAKAPPVGRYRDEEDGDPAFVIDHSSSIILLRFDDSTEIWMLTPQPGPGGSTLYKNDVGEIVLRVTRLGGLTLFRP
jgi:hypothetical protein